MQYRLPGIYPTLFLGQLFALVVISRTMLDSFAELERRRQPSQLLELDRDQETTAALGFKLKPTNYIACHAQRWDQVHSSGLKNRKLYRRIPAVVLDAVPDRSHFPRILLDCQNCFLPQCKLHPNNYYNQYLMFIRCTLVSTTLEIA
jgi:hypothetical protein